MSVFPFFASRPLVAKLFTISMLALGLSALYTIKRDANPSVDFGEMFIETRYLGASSEDVELKVTNKIEEELKGVSGIKRFTSTSAENISMVHIVIDPNENDQEKVKQDVHDAVSRVTDLPSEISDRPRVTELTTAVFPIIELGIQSDQSYRDLRKVAKLFSKKLQNLPGVARVEEFGLLDREIRIEISKEALIEKRLSLKEINQAIQNRNIRLSGGTFESYTSEKNIVTLAQFKNLNEVENVIVRSTFEGPQIKLKDIAVVNDTFEQTTQFPRMNGKQTISLKVFKSEHADIIKTCDAIKALIKQEAPSLKGAEVSYTLDISKYVKSQFDILSKNGLLGLVLVLGILTLFLNFRVAIWVALGIPVTLLGVVFLLPLWDANLDTVTMTGFMLVIGIIVDDAIIIGEQIFSRFQKGHSPVEASILGIQDVFWPVVTTLVTTFMAFAPMFFMPGIMGKFTFYIPLVITLAIVVSMLEVVVALPAHLGQSLQRLKSRHITVDAASQHHGRYFEKIKSVFESCLRSCLVYPKTFVLLTLVVFVATLGFAFKHMEFVLFPSKGADLFFIQAELPIGTSLQATSEKIREIEHLLDQMSEAELDSYVTKIGSLSDNFGVMEGENYTTIWVSLTPYGSRQRTADQIVASLREQSKTFEGYEKLLFRVENGGPPVGRSVTVRVVSIDDALRKACVNDLEQFLATLPGVFDIDRNDKIGKNQIEVHLDFEKCARLGLTVSDVATYIRIAFDGEIVTNVRYGDEDVNYRVVLEEDARSDFEFLKQLTIPNSEGKLIPLGQVAAFKEGPGISHFFHYNGDRAITLTADLDKELNSTLKIQKAVEEFFATQDRYHHIRVFFGGEAEETNESMEALMISFLFAVIGIYFVLILLFNSLKQPFMVMMAMPFGLMGVIWTFALHQEALGYLAMMGVIGLMGVVVNDSLVLVNRINEIKSESPQTPLFEVVVLGTTDRLRAVIMTTLTTVMGLLPLAYGIGGQDPFMSPMALSLGWGLLLATPLTLILIPCMYLIFEGRQKPRD